MHTPHQKCQHRTRNKSARFPGGERSSGWSKTVPLLFYVLLGICITLGVYLVLDWLLERREESRLKPKRQKRLVPPSPADVRDAAAFVMANGTAPPPERQESSQHR